MIGAIVVFCFIVTASVISGVIGFVVGSRKATSECAREINEVFRGNPKMLEKFRKAGKRRYGF